MMKIREQKNKQKRIYLEKSRMKKPNNTLFKNRTRKNEKCKFSRLF